MVTKVWRQDSPHIYAQEHRNNKTGCSDELVGIGEFWDGCNIIV